MESKNGENPRPLVSFILMAYNQQDYIAEAVNAALAQDYDNLELIISDDCSPDSTFDIISAITSEYEGKHRIVVNRNDHNLGLARHFNTLMAMAQGEIIVLAAGDDLSLPDRVSNTVNELSNEPGAIFVSFADTIIDAQGQVIKSKTAQTAKTRQVITLDNYLDGAYSGLSGASRGFYKSLFSQFGPLDAACPTEDTPCLLRGLLLGSGIVSPQPAIKYRKHGNNLSSFNSINRMDFKVITEQYRKDVERAEKEGTISAATAQRTRQWIDLNYQRKFLRQKVFSEPFNLGLFLKFLWSDKNFTLKEKLGILRRKIRS